MDEILAYLERHRDQALEQLMEFLRIPTVSADPSHQQDMQRGADFLHQRLRSIGLDAEVVPTEGHPLVCASWQGALGAPTVLVYGHYDVQPPDPLEEWISPPFSPTIRDGYIYARGATDDKGQLWTHIASVAAWMETAGRLPVNVKFLIEGEEEVGSDNLERFIASEQQRCACDIALISDTSQYGPDQPAITYGLRGIMACEVTLVGPKQDLHSGVFGGAVANPANVLARLIGSLHDSEGRVQIPGFYDAVRPLDDAERARLAALPFDESAFCAELGVDGVWGEAGYSTLERRWARPTCDVNGLVAGYTGVGPKTIVPAKATAKISCRLVPDQDPDQLTQALREHFAAQLPPGITMEFAAHHGCRGVVFDTDSAYMQAARRAIEQAFGVAPVFIREGGSIPVVVTFREQLGVDTLLLGWGQSTDNLHSPNERFRLQDFYRGMTASALFWRELAESA